MKTTAEYLEIAEAKHVSGYKLRLAFNDGTSRVMDFEPFLRRAQNPDLTQYRQLRKFKNFHLHYGNLMWGDYEMMFPIVDLYRGDILKIGENDSVDFVLHDAAPAKAASERKAAIVSYKKSKRKKF